MAEKRIKIQAQKATRTGSVRRFDDLGRIVVPREIRKRMGYEEGSPFEIIPIAEGILLVPYNPIETFGNRVDALLSDVKETENYRGMPDDAREAIKTKLQELVEVMQTYHVRSVEKGGDEYWWLVRRTGSVRTPIASSSAARRRNTATTSLSWHR